MKQTKENPTTDEIVLAHKRRTALVLYLAILFVAALTFVIISMVSQNQKLKDRSASALDKAEALQETNRELQKENKTLKDQITALESENEDYFSQLEALQTLETDYTALQTEAEALRADLGECNRLLEDKDTAFDLLLKAQAALQAEDMDVFSEAMDALKLLQNSLSPEGSVLYQSLLDAAAKNAE